MVTYKAVICVIVCRQPRAVYLDNSTSNTVLPDEHLTTKYTERAKFVIIDVQNPCKIFGRTISLWSLHESGIEFLVTISIGRSRLNVPEHMSALVLLCIE